MKPGFLILFMISPNTIEAIRQRTNIVEVIQQLVKLKKHGANYVGLCPFHNEKTASFTVTEAKGIYKCFGCGKSGDAIQFIMEHEGTGYIGAIEYLAGKYGIAIERTTEQKEYTKPPERLEKLHPDMIAYFEKRGISNNTLLRFNITQSTEWMPKANKEIPVICFNYYKDEQLVNIKFRGAAKDFKMEKGAELTFYNIDSLRGESEAIIVEGEIDCLSLYEAGIYNVVSVPNGATAGATIEYLNNAWSYFEDKTRIVLMTDNDDPGRALRDELARRLGKDKCLQVHYPADCKDANDILTKHGAKAIPVIIEQSTPWPIDGIVPMDDMVEEIKSYYTNGYPNGVCAQIGEFDDYLTFMPGQLTTVTGIPGHGKSEFVDYLMTKLARHHGWKWAVFSFENQPSSFHATKIMEKFSGLSFAHRKNPLQRMTYDQFDESIGLTDAYFNFANVQTVDVTLSGVLKKATELVKRKGIKGLLIDPWNYIEHQVPDNYTETQYISECLTQLKIFAIKYGVHVILVAHPTKMQRDVKTKKFDVPTLYSISGSAHFFNKTDNGICVYRDFDAQTVTAYIQKVRYSWLGKVGHCSFTYDTFTRQYKDI